MDKLWLIIKREYLTRVRRRSFIVATLLTPLGIALFLVVVIFIFSYESDDSKHIAVIDQGNILKRAIPDESNLYFKFVDDSLESLKASFDENPYDGILVIPDIKNFKAKKHTIYYYREKSLGLDVTTYIEKKIENSIRNYKIEMLNLDRKELEALETRVSIEPEPIKETSEDKSALTGIIGAFIGGAMGMIMYMVVFIYGMMVMRSVMEEKVNRIVEVMISSVRPFELMMGKIIGVGAVGLTQVAIWAVLIPLVYFIVILLFGFDASQIEATAMATPEIDEEDLQLQIAQAITEFSNQNWLLIIPLFIFYFLGGYFLYSSLFAAVGSAMGDDLGEGQSLTIPITIPVIMAFYIMFVAVRAPQSSLAVWSSIFPLFSPIVMPARLAFDPPLWQIFLSVLLLTSTSIFFVWLSARIYRIGILMYGKKVTLKELWKWMFYKD